MQTQRYLSQMVVATAAVTLIPLAAIWGLRSSGATSSPWVCVPLAVVISLAVTAAGSAYWQRRRPAPELLFSELMLWNWIRRRRAERAIGNATELLMNAVDLSTEFRLQLLRELANSLETHDPYTIGHSHRVARHSAMVARKLGLDDGQTRTVRAAAAIHDVGKLRVDPNVLNKPGTLTDVEYELVKTHTTVGAQLVSGLGDNQLTAIVRHHHERVDGSGYPGGLAGEEIPLGARIVAVTDTFDAITSGRPYRPARPHKQALDILREESGAQLDGRIVEAFIACYAGKRAIVAWAALSSLPQTTIGAISRGSKRSAQVRVAPGSTVPSAATMAAVAGVAIAAPVIAHHHRVPQPPPTTTAVMAAAPVAPATPVKTAHRTRHAAKTTPSHRPAPALAPAPAPLVVPPILAPAPQQQLSGVQQRRTATTPRKAPGPPLGTPRPQRPPATRTPAPPSTPTPQNSPEPTSIPTATSTTTIGSVTTVTTTSTTTTTTTTSATTSQNGGDPCKGGGYASQGYSNQGRCVSQEHGHNGRHNDR